MSHVQLKLLRCQQCSAGLYPASGHTLTRCAFCGSAYLIEGTPIAPADAPVRMLGFAVGPEAARAAFTAWIRSGFLAPGDLARAASASEPAPVLVPLYLGRARAHSNWTAEVVRHRMKKVKVVIPPVGEVKTGVNVRMRSDSHFISGAHDADHANVFVLASSGLIASNVFERVADYDFTKLEPMPEPGWIPHTIEDPQISLADAREKLRVKIEELERDSCRAMIPGGQVADLRVNTVLSDLTVELVYAPLYVVNYRYDERPFRALVNGVTGRVEGDWPLSLPRLAVAGATLLALPAALLWLLWLLFRRRR